MAYYHKKCNGKISILRRRCSKCGKKWPISAWFQYPPPKDMTKYIVEQKEESSYAKWGDKIPFVKIVASRLPNWPRWARILVLCLLIGLVVLITIYLRGC